MSESGGFTLAEAQLELAKTTNGRVWELFEKPGPTEDENDELVHAAHASAYLWLQVGTAVHWQRAEWLVSRVYCVLGLPEAALRHARRCSELTTQHPNLMEDFDRAYGHECLARANGPRWKPGGCGAIFRSRRRAWTGDQERGRPEDIPL